MNLVKLNIVLQGFEKNTSDYVSKGLISNGYFVLDVTSHGVVLLAPKAKLDQIAQFINNDRNFRRTEKATISTTEFALIVSSNSGSLEQLDDERARKLWE